ncbi:MAG: sulfotransferase domain-containing protein [Chloroflexi bacterium]|nr:sulfotransferase domain-containing protein [Chloroflexota bacterium]
MRVDFMMIGAQKCGTTSLASQLAQHPAICFSQLKEPGYFNQTDDWEAGLDHYHGLFAPRNGQICGEASTMYTFLPEWEHTHTRLFAYNPNLKLIYIMRNPVERTISNYAHDLVRGLVNGDSGETLLLQDAYLNRSRYYFQMKPYVELFPMENILLLVFEEYIADQQSTLNRITEFLNIHEFDFADAGPSEKHKTLGTWYLKYASVRKLAATSLFQKVRPSIPIAVRRPIRRMLSNKLDVKPPIKPEVREVLWNTLAPEINAVEQLMGRRVESWHTGTPDE